MSCALQPHELLHGLACLHFARRYLGDLFDFFSSPYLDVSVQVVPISNLWIGLEIPHKGVGCPIRRSTGQSLLTANRRVSLVFCVLHRYDLPRHPFYALRVVFYFIYFFYKGNHYIAVLIIDAELKYIEIFE